MNLADRLNEYRAKNVVPMHMPGHKRNTEVFDMGNPYGLDITEIEGFDNLHNPTGILKESMQNAAKQYNCARTWYLVNGSSVGLLAAVLALTDRREAVIAARNCHISVYNAIYENELYPVYTYPKFVDNLWISHEISPEDVEKLLVVNKVDSVDNSDCREIGAVVITSPTFEGNVSDIRSIADIAHKYSVPLIVDEAHGAHFRYSDSFPESALDLGADVVVQSIHKTLPSFTQTALLHVSNSALNREDCIRRIDRYLNILQTTSPSYLLMASIDKCLDFLNSSGGKAMMEDYVVRLKALRGRLGRLSVIKTAPVDDISKIVIYAENGYLQGKQLYDILLKQYDIQPEMASYRYVTLMTSMADKQEYYDRLLAALSDIDAKLAEPLAERGESFDGYAEPLAGYTAFLPDAGNRPSYTTGAKPSPSRAMPRNEIKLIPYDAVNSDCEEVPVTRCKGRISAATVCMYPPGIPLICPGEIISEAAAFAIEDALRQGFEIMGLSKDNGSSERKILCLR